VVNELYDDMRRIWPDGNAFDFCIALELEPHTDWNVLESLKDAEFVGQVVQEGRRRGIHQSNVPPDRHALDRSIGLRPRRQPSVPVEDDTDPSSVESEEFSTRPIRPKTWTDAEIARLKAVITDLADAPTRTWEMVSQQMAGRSLKQCEQSYKCLRSTHAVA
jgi:hypothetical protein